MTVLARIVVLAAGASAAALVGALATTACNAECGCAVDELYFVLPADGANDVPTDTKIWSTESSCPGSLTLRDADGVPVPAGQSCLDDALGVGLVVLSPYAALQPYSEYTIDGFEPYRFTTGAGPRSSPPPSPPEIEAVDLESHRDRCGDGRFFEATYTLAGAGAVFMMDAGATADIDPDTLFGSVSFLSPTPRGLRLGEGGCLGDNFPGEASVGATTSVRFAALDLAGRFSGWSEPEEVTVGAGCDVAGDTGLAAWLLLLPLALRSRRSRGRS